MNSRNNPIAENQNVHFGSHEAVKRLFRSADYRFVFIKRGVQDHRHPGYTLERLDQPIITRVGCADDGLQPPGTINMRDGRYLVTFFVADLEYFRHKRHVIILLEPLGDVLAQNRGSERPEGFTTFDLQD